LLFLVQDAFWCVGVFTVCGFDLTASSSESGVAVSIVLALEFPTITLKAYGEYIRTNSQTSPKFFFSSLPGHSMNAQSYSTPTTSSKLSTIYINQFHYYTIY
jgi:hypothetical protein